MKAVKVLKRSFPWITALIGIGLLVFVVSCTKPEEPLTPQAAPPTPPPPAKLAKLEVEPPPGPMRVGELHPLPVRVLDQEGRTRDGVVVTWASENPSVTTVGPEGVLTAVSPGQATVTAFVNGLTASIEVSVEGPAAAQVDKSGRAAVVSPGGTAIVATADQKAPSDPVRAAKPGPTRLQIRPEKASGIVGDTLQLTAVVIDSKGHEQTNIPVTWKSGDSNLSLVDSKGLATLKASGTVTISAAAEEKSAAAVLTISSPLIAKLEPSASAVAAPRAEQTKPSAPAREETPHRVGNPNINIDILDYSWKAGFVWENLNKTETSWTARVKNNNPEPRHICLNYEFLDEDDLPVFQNGKCEVLLGKSEGIISGHILIQSRLINDVKKSNVIALEAHRLHSFVPAPPVAPPTSQ